MKGMRKILEQALREAGFPNSIKKWEECNFYLGEFRLFNTFVMLKLTCVYIKRKVKKNDTTGMTVLQMELL